MKKNNFYDHLYGEICLPIPILEIASCPEVLRLREIRMSSIDLFNFPAFSNITRYEHAIGTAYLAFKIVEKWKLRTKDKLEIITAALMHDIAAPAFSHLTEMIMKEYYNFDHEIETAKIILGKTSEFRKSTIEPIFAGEVPRSKKILKKYNIDPHKVFDYLMGKEKFGRLLKGTIDIDNIDNVFRAAYYMGVDFQKGLPLEIALGFINGEDQIEYDFGRSHLISKWLEIRSLLYRKLLLNTYDLCRECMLKSAIKKAVKLEIINKSHWKLTDQELIAKLINSKDILPEGKEIYEIINRMRIGDIFTELGLFWIDDRNITFKIKHEKENIERVELLISSLLKYDIVIHYMSDKRSRRVSNIRATLDTYLFKEKDVINIGEDPQNILFGVYSHNRTIIKKDEKGNAVLDKNTKKQIKFSKNELKEIVLSTLMNYFKTSSGIQLFSENLIR